MGLGLKPDLAGRGLELKFLLADLEVARRRFASYSLHLPVATFNERAIRLYAHADFQRAGVFMQSVNGGVRTFSLMTREA